MESACVGLVFSAITEIPNLAGFLAVRDSGSGPLVSA